MPVKWTLRKNKKKGKSMGMDEIQDISFWRGKRERECPQVVLIPPTSLLCDHPNLI